MQISKNSNKSSICFSVLIAAFGVMTLSFELENVNAQFTMPQISLQQHNSEPAQNASNFTASIPLATSLLEVLNSKMTHSLADAMKMVTNSTGPNATILAASVQVERGYLVYRIVALNDDNNIHIVLVDPANGNILSVHKFPADGLSSVPLGCPEGEVPIHTGVVIPVCVEGYIPTPGLHRICDVGYIYFDGVCVKCPNQWVCIKRYEPACVVCGVG